MKPLRLYRGFLAVTALGGFGLCQWYHASDVRDLTLLWTMAFEASPHFVLVSQLENRELYQDMSLKYLLTAIPQLLAAVLLLYYACTFSRASSAFVHRMLAESCLHQGGVTLLVASLAFSAFHVSHSVCCSFPGLCPVNPATSQLDRVVPCPESVAHLTHYNLYPRLVHCCATFTMLLALSSIQTAHTIKDLSSRVHRAKLVTFSRREPVHAASASVTF